ncbi:hypothetical protein J4447_00365 [Candidatus Pacearchaeota archaeon]|nr:hypothetical protein [Candidatus Pacearchaeota archaeon]
MSATTATVPDKVHNGKMVFPVPIRNLDVHGGLEKLAVGDVVKISVKKWGMFPGTKEYTAVGYIQEIRLGRPGELVLSNVNPTYNKAPLFRESIHAYPENKINTIYLLYRRQGM